ncbi:aminopeptidase P N-terminal domain-containing protein [Puia dinghuensis]|uniref:Xaa-Pro aminopeptidase n=1 Tax=Puia dinghuensis TaxID=1792502 RepID=A0A8J2UH42_9BACT|nr:aminopeptidase P N-terminal domain-containing protein [Puia dinghuensis]GGB16101.1 Xaa-Pro aminopeptidase [Puia dinghuensis]
MRYFPNDPELFTANRGRFAGAMEPGSVAVFVSNDEMPANGDSHYPFRQSSDLFWLTGVWQEDTMLVLFPGHPEPRYREVLVLARPNPMKEKWDGKRLSAEEGRAISGVGTVLWTDTIEGFLQQWIHMADSIYLNTNENDRKRGPLITREYRFIREMKEKFPLHDVRRAAPVLRRLRAIKSAAEVALMQRAADITGETFRHLLHFIRPGVMEYEIEAEIWRGFISRRSPGPAYESIIASGDSARTLHYIANNGECRDGELVLMDFGAQFGGYSADLTRSVPVNGRFTRRQAEVYNACLAVQEFAKGLLRPGLLPADYVRQVGEETARQLVRIGLLTEADVKNGGQESPAHTKYMYHGVSHHLGIDVHDLGPRHEPFREGMVLTVEPGIYIEEEQMGIRIENDVWITADGVVDLMKKVPITVEEIEGVMAHQSGPRGR